MTKPGHAQSVERLARRAVRAGGAFVWLMAAACSREGGDGMANTGVVPPADPGEARRPASTAVEPRPLALGTFEAARPDVTVLASRQPADPASTILVPATTLFPGSAWLVPNIDNPYSDAESIAAGERHFAAFNCAGCHAPLGGGGMGPPLSDEKWIYGGEPAQIFLSIMHGRAAGMPAWSSMLPARTVWEMVAYIETLQDIDDYAAARGFDPPAATGERGGGNRTERAQ